MADDFDALRTIGVPQADLDPERAERMRARALASLPGAVRTHDGHDAAGSVLTDTGTRRTVSGRRGDPTTGADPRPALEVVGSSAAGRGGLRTGPDRAVPPGRGRRSFLVVAAAAAVVAVLVGIGVARTGRSTDVVADQPTTTTITDLAAAAGLTVDRPLAPGEHAHLRVEYGEPATASDGSAGTLIRTRETWATSTGAGRERQSAASLVDDAGVTTEAVDEAQDESYTEGSPGFGAFSYDELRNLPTEPGALRQALRSGTWGAPDDDSTEARFIGQILMSDVTPPAVRAAALTLLADRGATVLEDAADHAGLHGIGIVSPQPDGSTVVYVVSRSGVLLGSYVVEAGAPIDPAAAESWATVEARDRTTTAG